MPITVPLVVVPPSRTTTVAAPATTCAAVATRRRETWNPLPTPPPSHAVVSIRATPPATDLYKLAKSAAAIALTEADGELGAEVRTELGGVDGDAARVLPPACTRTSGDFGCALGWSPFERRITAHPPPAATTSTTITAPATTAARPRLRPPPLPGPYGRPPRGGPDQSSRCPCDPTSGCR